MATSPLVNANPSNPLRKCQTTSTTVATTTSRSKARLTAHPAAADYAAWYLATIRCSREHAVAPLVGRSRQKLNALGWPCQSCCVWADAVVASVLVEKRKVKRGPKTCRRK